MSDNIIEVRDIGKKYIINHQQSERYTALRDVVANKVKNFGKKKLDTGEKEEFWALKDVSFDIKQGDKVGIIGRNGAGKSTLLKLLSRITDPTTGSIKINGRVASLLEVGTGFHPELTGRENIFLNGAILGMSKQEIKKKFDEIVEFAEVEKFLDTPVKRFSSGMYVRLAFSVAAHLEPEILIVDEVLAVGDAQFQKKCLGKMGDVSKEGRTVLFVSHNMGAIQQLCDKGILLDKGTLCKKGRIDQVIKEYFSTQSKFMSSKSYIYFEEKNNKEFQLLDISLKNMLGHYSKMFSCDEDIIIEMNCISRSIIPALYGYLAIFNQLGQRVLVSDTFDIPPNICDFITIGKHTIKVTIPARSLSAGQYSISVNFTSEQSNNGFNVDVHENVITFSLEDSLTQRGNSREGYFSTLLKWSITKDIGGDKNEER